MKNDSYQDAWITIFNKFFEEGGTIQEENGELNINIPFKKEVKFAKQRSPGAIVADLITDMKIMIKEKRRE